MDINTSTNYDDLKVGDDVIFLDGVGTYANLRKGKIINESSRTFTVQYRYYDSNPIQRINKKVKFRIYKLEDGDN